MHPRTSEANQQSTSARAELLCCLHSSMERLTAVFKCVSLEFCSSFLTFLNFLLFVLLNFYNIFTFLRINPSKIQQNLRVEDVKRAR